MAEQIKPKYPKVGFVTYVFKTDKCNKTRVVKINGILQMISKKKGFVKECEIENLDKTGVFEIDENMVNEEIGKIKFLSALYWYGILKD